MFWSTWPSPSSGSGAESFDSAIRPTRIQVHPRRQDVYPIEGPLLKGLTDTAQRQIFARFLLLGCAHSLVSAGQAAVSSGTLARVLMVHLPVRRVGLTRSRGLSTPAFRARVLSYPLRTFVLSRRVVGVRSGRLSTAGLGYLVLSHPARTVVSTGRG